jgi:hypothetical protein
MTRQIVHTRVSKKGKLFRAGSKRQKSKPKMGILKFCVSRIYTDMNTYAVSPARALQVRAQYPEIENFEAMMDWFLDLFHDGNSGIKDDRMAVMMPQYMIDVLRNEKMFYFDKGFEGGLWINNTWVSIQDYYRKWELARQSVGLGQGDIHSKDYQEKEAMANKIIAEDTSVQHPSVDSDMGKRWKKSFKYYFSKKLYDGVFDSSYTKEILHENFIVGVLR